MNLPKNPVVMLFLRAAMRFDMIIERLSLTANNAALNPLIYPSENWDSLLSMNSNNNGGKYMIITATELRNNIGKYLSLASSEDIYISKNGKITAMLTAPFQSNTHATKDISDKNNRTTKENPLYCSNCWDEITF